MHPSVKIKKEDPVIEKLSKREELLWCNPDCGSAEKALDRLPIGLEDILDAESRLERFAPFLIEAFPETRSQGGIIESPLLEIDRMKQWLNDSGADIGGRLFLKMDSHLAVAGSVKARGGIYEILKHTEELAVKSGLIKDGDDYSKLCCNEIKDFFSDYSIHVGSTGNLGLSIGIISAAIGYKVYVHMSADAKKWKKDLLRSKGVNVLEYASDYSKAVEEGRKIAKKDNKSYFVDDENSKDLFLGYAVAARRLANQLKEAGVMVDSQHPLAVYIPCGVGGAPGGICFGLKHQFGDAVSCYFAEPVESPCMLLGMASGLNSGICVQDISLSGKTHADGLAVGRPSAFVGSMMKELLSGIFTVKDGALFDYMRALISTEGIFIEPSACAAFKGPAEVLHMKSENYTHIVWATGGSLVPAEERKLYENMYI